MAEILTPEAVERALAIIGLLAIYLAGASALGTLLGRIGARHRPFVSVEIREEDAEAWRALERTLERVDRKPRGAA